MAQNTVVGVEIKVKGDQAKASVGSFKKQLREANEELVTMSERFGATSKEAIEAAKRVGKLKDAIGDAKDLADAFSPDKKFQAFAGAIQGAVSGFAALQGAQALFGSESEELNKTLLKVQGALALSQGLNGIIAAKDAFVNLGSVIKDSVISAFGTLRGAIISTGIGALVIGVGLLVTNFEKVRNAIINAIPGAAKFFEVVGDIVDTVKGWLGVSEDMLDTQKALADATRDLSDALSGYYDEIDNVTKAEVLRARIAGKTQVEIDAIDADGVNKKVQLNDRLIGLAKQYGISTVTLEQERQKNIQAAELKGLENRAKAAEEQRRKQEDAAKKAEEERKRKEKELADFRAKLSKDLSDQERKALEEGFKNATDFDQLQTDVADAQAKARFEISLANAQDLKALDDERVRQAKEKADQEILIRQSVADSSELLSNAIGKQTAVGKALGIASALINTYQGATEVLRSKSILPEPFATISKVANVAAIIATGIRSVKAIASVKVPGGGGGASVPSVGTPQALTPQNASTTLDQDQVNQIGNAAGRNFVLETDVSSNQERIRRLNRAARIS